MRLGIIDRSHSGQVLALVAVSLLPPGTRPN